MIFLIILALLSRSLMAEDPSTPMDGNLYRPLSSSFLLSNLVFYENGSTLDDHDLVLQNSRIYRERDSAFAQTPVNKTSGTDIVYFEHDSFVVLTGETTEYPHGILGDKIESTGFEVYKKNRLIGRYRLPENRVFETLRPTIADISPKNPGPEIILTSSSGSEGARVDVFSLEGRLIGSSAAIGRGFRWLHVLGVAPFGADGTNKLAIVRTPHINGILDILEWKSGALVSVASLSRVSTHQIGSDNLNMALLFNADAEPDAELLIPTADFRTLLLIKLKGTELRVLKSFELPAPLKTNLYITEGGSLSIWFALINGTVGQIISDPAPPF